MNFNITLKPTGRWHQGTKGQLKCGRIEKVLCDGVPWANPWIFIIFSIRIAYLSHCLSTTVGLYGSFSSNGSTDKESWFCLLARSSAIEAWAWSDYFFLLLLRGLEIKLQWKNTNFYLSISIIISYLDNMVFANRKSWTDKILGKLSTVLLMISWKIINKISLKHSNYFHPFYFYNIHRLISWK